MVSVLYRKTRSVALQYATPGVPVKRAQNGLGYLASFFLGQHALTLLLYFISPSSSAYTQIMRAGPWRYDRKSGVRLNFLFHFRFQQSACHSNPSPFCAD